MPVVPFSPTPSPAEPSAPAPDPTFMDMAAAMVKRDRIQKVSDREIARVPKGTADADLVGNDEFGKEVLRSGRRSKNIEDERPDEEVIMLHDEKLKPLELKKAPTS